MPSFYDPFANVTVEALAMGLKVGTSLQNGGHEIINEKNGILFEDLTNIENIASNLKKLMETPKTWEQSVSIRNSVKHLEFSKQLQEIIKQTIKSC